VKKPEENLKKGLGGKEGSSTRDKSSGVDKAKRATKELLK
jgi:hypothetical protein